MKNYSKYLIAFGLALTTGCSHNTKKQDISQTESLPTVSAEVSKPVIKNAGRDYFLIFGYHLPKKLTDLTHQVIAKEIKNSPEYSEKYKNKEGTLSYYVKQYGSCGLKYCPEVWKEVFKKADINKNKQIEKSELELLLSK